MRFKSEFKLTAQGLLIKAGGLKSHLPKDSFQQLSVYSYQEA